MTGTILIADDDRDLAHALALRCRRLGLNVIVVHDGLSALNAVQDQSPDVVCLDVGMPGGNGLSVCEMISAEPAWSSIPVIMLTGKNDEDTVRRCHDMLAYYVLKGDGDSWGRIEPLIQELLGAETVPSISSIA